MLLRTTNVTVYAAGPHDGVCTVYYGDNVIEDFPVSVLKFKGDDADYFKGATKSPVWPSLASVCAWSFGDYGWVTCR